MPRSSFSAARLSLFVALFSTAPLVSLAPALSRESADALRLPLMGTCLFLFAVLCAGALLTYREDRLRRKAVDALHNSENRMRAVLETAVDAIISIDDHGIVQRINQAAERMLGYDRSELVGHNVKLIMPSPEGESHDNHLAEYRATGRRRIIGIGREVTCRRKDGSLFPADLAVGEYRVDGHRKFTGFLRDVTDRKRAESRIRAQAALLDRARDAILVRDLDDRITYWNQAAERLYGWTSEQACGQTCTELFFHGDRSALDAARRAVFSGDEWVGELRKSTRDGREVIVESRWSLLRDSDSRPQEILSIETDITEKKDRERQVLRAQRLESIGTLAGGIAHDLNNMLTPILISARLLKKDRPASERDGLIANILASAERGSEMIKQLLSFTGGVETARTRVDLREVVREVASLLEHTLPRSIDIQTRVADDLWPVSGDATQLSQVLMNLCVNARDAMPGGGRLSIAAANQRPGEFPPPSAAAGDPAPQVWLTVSDTGTGIPADVLDRVFDPFFTTKDIGKGTGLGLSTALGIVRSHGGTIRIASTSGRGTTFQIELPADASPADVRVAPPPSAIPLGRADLVLVVDDESVLLAAAKATLEDAGYRVLTAADGDEGLEIFRRRRGEVAAVIVDMMMPGRDGAATMRELRALDPRLGIIASSGLRTADDAARAVADCATAFLQKPYTDAQLLATLSQVLSEAGRPDSGGRQRNPAT